MPLPNDGRGPQRGDAARPAFALPGNGHASAWRVLLRKEWRELLASKSYWVLLALAGPLVGLSFANAVRSYSEVSAGAGNACGLACAPLIGIWGPTFSAYEIAAIFLLPFVAIRAVGGDRQSGALTLELQRPLSPIARMAAKATVLLGGWLITGLAAVIAIVLWTSYGGGVYAPEVIVVALGHVLNGALTIALALAIGSIADNPSTAAIVTLAITIGTWVVAFAAALQGGIWTILADYTPGAVVNMFQHALVQVNVVLATIVGILAGVGVAAIWLRVYLPPTRRWGWTAAALAVGLVVAIGATQVRGSWDASESHYNSFGEADQEALEHLPQPLAVEVHLAPQDPRRVTFDRGPLAKLQRAVAHLQVRYVSRTDTGMYEESDPGYGEIRFTYQNKTAATHLVTDDGVLETINDVAPLGHGEDDDAAFLGHPLVATAKGAGWIFYLLWPTLVVGAALLLERKER